MCLVVYITSFCLEAFESINKLDLDRLSSEFGKREVCSDES
jgi:hypothetical protein